MIKKVKKSPTTTLKPVNIYILDYWLPFPASEYGGQIAAIAKDKKQLKKVLLAYCSEYPERISNSIKNSTCYKLEDSESVKTGVIRAFTT